MMVRRTTQRSSPWAMIVLFLALAMVGTGLFIAYHPSAVGDRVPSIAALEIVRHAPGIFAALALMAAGSLLAAWLTRVPGPRMSTCLPVPRPRWDWPSIGAVILGLACNLTLWANLGAERYGWWNGLLFVAAMASWGFAVSRWDRVRGFRLPFAAADYTLATACALLSVAANCVGLVRWNFSWIGDEGAFFFSARGIAGDPQFNLFDLTWVYQSHPALDSLYQAAALRLFGADIWGWRFGEVLVVAAVAAMVFLLGTLLFDRLTGVIAAIVIGTNHYLFAFTRIGYNNLHALFWSTLAVLMIALAWRTRRAIFSYLAGCAIGMCFYTFFVAVFIGPILALLLGLSYLGKPTRRQTAAGAMLVFVFAIVVLPGLISTPPSELREIAQRESQREQAAVDPIGTFVHSLARSSMFFVVNQEWTNHYVGAAALDPLSAGLFAIGLAGAALGVRRRAERTVFLWFGLGLVLIAVTNYLPYPQLTRLLFLMPPAALLAGLGGRIVDRAITNGFGAPRWVACVVLIAIVAGVPPLNHAILHHISPKRIHLDPTTLAFKAAMDHPKDAILFVSAERNQNLELMLRCYPEIEARASVVGLDGLELPPQPIGDPPQLPIIWTREQGVRELLEASLGSSYRVEVDSEPGGVSTAWLFLPCVPEEVREPR